MEVLRKAFIKPLDPLISQFVSSVDDDGSLIEADLQGSLAHTEMLMHCGLITKDQGEKIKFGLNDLLERTKANDFELEAKYEDVHMNVEKRLEVLIGKDALRLHTARSRNDQVATDLRLYVGQQIDKITDYLVDLQRALLLISKHSSDIVMPGYTHLQPAQPIVFAHVALAFFEMFMRDMARLADAKKRTQVSVLGAGALSGSRLPIDPDFTAKQLGFAESFANSLDAVSDRDFIGEFLFAASLASNHLSQLAETLIIWNSNEFGYVILPDNVTTSSSLMPQKKNADPLELIRAKSGIALGELVNFLTIIKGLPIGYNRDLQETKPTAIRVATSLGLCLQVMTIMISNIELNRERMLAAASNPELMATDLVEYLVTKGLAFRDAHEAVATLVQFAREKNYTLDKLDLMDYQRSSQYFVKDVFATFDPTKSLAEKNSPGSTGFASVKTALKKAEERLQEAIIK